MVPSLRLHDAGFAQSGSAETLLGLSPKTPAPEQEAYPALLLGLSPKTPVVCRGAFADTSLGLSPKTSALKQKGFLAQGRSPKSLVDETESQPQDLQAEFQHQATLPSNEPWPAESRAASDGDLKEHECLPGLSPRTPAAHLARGSRRAKSVTFASEPAQDQEREPCELDLQRLGCEAAEAPLPPGWCEHNDRKGRPFFFHSLSSQSVWHHPLKDFYDELIELIRTIRQESPTYMHGSLERRASSVECYLEKLYEKALADLEPWSGPYDSPEGEYYYNEARQTSSWQNPVDPWEQQLTTAHRILSLYLGLSSDSPVSTQQLEGFASEQSHAKTCRSFKAVVVGVLVARHLSRTLAGPRRCYAKDRELDPDIIRQIDLDIPRTAGGNAEILARLGVTRALLLQQAAEDPSLGYCQGMNMVAALFAVASQNQVEAYKRFHALIETMRGLWQPGFPLLHEGMGIFEQLAGSRPWFLHLQQHGIGTELYLPRAWLPLFAFWMPLSSRLVVLRKLEQHGIEGLLALSVALLDNIGSNLLEQGDDIDGVLQVLENLGSCSLQPAALLPALDILIPLASSVVQAGSAWKRQPQLRREGSRVLDDSGREAFFMGSRKHRMGQVKSSAKAMVGKALIRFSFRDALRHKRGAKEAV